MLTRQEVLLQPEKEFYQTSFIFDSDDDELKIQFNIGEDTTDIWLSDLEMRRLIAKEN